jgi:lipopolysaccharide/colanic/teichoic acid biosynthesis glycosyltransferase
MEAQALVELPLDGGALADASSGQSIASLDEVVEALADASSGQSIATVDDVVAKRSILSEGRWLVAPVLVAMAFFAATLVDSGTVLAACFAAGVAAFLWFLVWVVDQAPQAMRVAGSGLSADVSLRVPVAVALVLSVAQDAGHYPIGTIPIVIALTVATLSARALSRVWSPTARVLIVGSGEVARHVGHLLVDGRRATVVGYVDDRLYEPTPEDEGLAVVGTLAELPALVAEYRADGVVFAFSAQRDKEVVQAMRLCRELGVSVSVVPRLFQELDRRAVLRRISGLPIVTVDPSLRDRRLPTLTRVLDVLMAVVLCVALAPLLLVIALAIVIESPGSVFYRAERVGQDGVLFKMLKFRKMRPDASGSRITTANDARFTRIGGFLHASKLDELPQLWNVLRGDMTLVGPRPEDPEYVALYPDDYREILRLRPGITGLAAVKYRFESDLLSGPDSEELYRTEILPNKIAIEQAYAARRNFGLDLRILLWTSVALLRGVRVTRCPVTEHLTFQKSSRRA